MVTQNLAQNHFVKPATVLEKFRFPNRPCTFGPKLLWGKSEFPQIVALQQGTSACSAAFLRKPEFLKNSARYHKIVLGHHKGISKLSKPNLKTSLGTRNYVLCMST